MDYALARMRAAPDSRAVISPGAVVASVLPVYLLIVAGAVFRRTGILRKEGDEGIMKLVFNLMLPCLILDKILGNTVLRSGSAVLGSIAVGFALIVASIFIGLAVGRLIGLERGTGMRTFAITSGVQNFGFVAAPVIEALWGGSALAVMFVHNIGVEIAMWSLGIMVMSGERGISWRKLINGPLLAVAAGLLLVALGLDTEITGPPRKAISMIGVGAFPIAVFITGSSMMDLAGFRETHMADCCRFGVGAARAGTLVDSHRRQISAARHRAQAGPHRPSRHARRHDRHPAGTGLWRPPRHRRANRHRHHPAQPVHPPMDHHLGLPVDRPETLVALMRGPVFNQRHESHRCATVSPGFRSGMPR